MFDNKLELTINNEIFIINDVEKSVYKKSPINKEKIMCSYNNEFYNIIKSLYNKTKTKSYISSRNGLQSEYDFLTTFNKNTKNVFLQKSHQEKYPFNYKNGESIVKSKTFHVPLMNHLDIIPIKCIKKKSDFNVICKKTNEHKANIEFKSCIDNIRELPNDISIINNINNINFLEIYKYSGDSKHLTDKMITNGNISARNILRSLKDNCKVNDYIYDNTHIVYKITYPKLNTTKYILILDILKNVHLKFDINKGNKSIDRVVIKLGRIKNVDSIKIFDTIEDIINHINIL